MHRRRFLYSLLLLLVCLSLLAIPFWNDRIVQHYVDKIWLHRTNTVEKLHEFECEYRSFECDVIYSVDSACYEIGHDSLTGISLKPYLDFLSTHPDSRLWLDYKNLNEANCVQSEQVLTELLSLYGVEKKRLIVESRDWQSLQHFSQMGYYTSCYLDVPNFQSFRGEELDCALDSIRQISCSGAVSAISFPAKYYNRVCDIDCPVDLLTWEHRRWAWQLPFFSRSRRILKDERVKVLLVKEKGEYHQ